MHPSNRKPDDPYNGFKDDRERRRALNTRARSYAVASVAIALTSTHSPATKAAFRWLASWLT